MQKYFNEYQSIPIESQNSEPLYFFTNISKISLKMEMSAPQKDAPTRHSFIFDRFQSNFLQLSKLNPASFHRRVRENRNIKKHKPTTLYNALKNMDDPKHRTRPNRAG